MDQQLKNERKGDADQKRIMPQCWTKNAAGACTVHHSAWRHQAACPYQSGQTEQIIGGAVKKAGKRDQHLDTGCPFSAFIVGDDDYAKY